MNPCFHHPKSVKTIPLEIFNIPASGTASCVTPQAWLAARLAGQWSPESLLSSLRGFRNPFLEERLCTSCPGAVRLTIKCFCPLVSVIVGLAFSTVAEQQGSQKGEISPGEKTELVWQVSLSGWLSPLLQPGLHGREAAALSWLVADAAFSLQNALRLCGEEAQGELRSSASRHLPGSRKPPPEWARCECFTSCRCLWRFHFRWCLFCLVLCLGVRSWAGSLLRRASGEGSVSVPAGWEDQLVWEHSAEWHTRVLNLFRILFRFGFKSCFHSSQSSQLIHMPGKCVSGVCREPGAHAAWNKNK